jgi:hypothetical protein
MIHLGATALGAVTRVTLATGTTFRGPLDPPDPLDPDHRTLSPAGGVVRGDCRACNSREFCIELRHH